VVEAGNYNQHSATMNSLQDIQQFRNQIFQNLGKGRNAFMDLMDAVLTSRSVSSLAEFSLSPLFRRQYASVYKVLQNGLVPRQTLMKECIKYLPTSGVVVLAGDHTAWSRLDAVTLQERTYEHQPQPLGNKPVTLGQGYSTIAWIPETEGSWALPLLHERITSFEKPVDKAATQLRLVAAQVSNRILFLEDSEYACAPFLNQTADIDCDKLLRLRPNRVLYYPPEYSGVGRPPLHGNKFSLKDAATWGDWQEELYVVDPKLGNLRVRMWHDLHLTGAADKPVRLILVDRLDAPNSKPLWLIWISSFEPDLTQIWQQYLRRFTIEHWYRFVRKRLHWTLPNLSSSKQTDTWSDLMPLLTWQLWLAKDLVIDCPLPWQKKMTKLTPGRVADSFATVLARIGTPACVPKTRGKAPGWPAGKTRRKKPRYPTVKKSYKKPSQAKTSTV
jgi:hypothetical protein